MNPESLEDNVPLFVLGELEGLELATFEMALARDDALRAAVRDYAETFATAAARASDASGPPPAVWAAIERRVRPAPERKFSETRRRRLIQPWLWPAAAALLLALNLAQWFWPRGRVASSAHDRSASASVDARRRAGDREGGGAASNPDGSSASSENRTNPSTPRAEDDAAARAVAPGRDLAEEYRKLQVDYARLSQLVLPLLDAPFVEYHDSRVWIAEMREKPSSTETTAAIGLWDRARELAPEHGVAVLPDRWRLAGGVVVNPEMWLRAGGTGMASAAPPAAAPSNPVETAPATFAMALLNSAEGLGYLDLYNLPNVPAGTEMKVWLKGDGDSAYSELGVVPPSLVGGSGGLVFRVPTSTATTQPQRVLITIEPQTPRSQPSGPTILEGP